jgi:hypothetical protein
VDVNHEFAAGTGSFDLKVDDLMVSQQPSDQECRQNNSNLSGIDAFYQQPGSESEIKAEDLFASLPDLSSAPGSGFSHSEAMDTSPESIPAAAESEPRPEVKQEVAERAQSGENKAPAAQAMDTVAATVPVKPKRKRGRPSKRQLAMEAAADLPKILAKNADKYESEEQILATGDASDRLALLLLKAFDKNLKLRDMATLPEPDEV